MVRRFEIPDFLLGNWGVAIFNEPEVKLFDYDQVIDNGVLHELLTTSAGSCFQGCNPGIEGWHIILIEWPDKTTPANKGVNQFVCPLRAGIS